MWQHVKPQRDIDHEVKPVLQTVIQKGKKVKLIAMPQVCDTCGNKIKQVPDNEGPESLKSFFPL